MASINFVEVTEASGNKRLINVQYITLVEEYQKPDYNLIYLDVTGADNAPIIIYVQDEYTSIIDAIKDVLTIPAQPES
jgi:hypothetical protein